MSVKHINASAKEQSGVVLSGNEAVKVFSMFETTKTAEQIANKKRKLKEMFKSTKRAS